MTENIYKTVRAINVNEHTEKKGRFTYLSWAWAVDQLLQLDHTATWEFSEPKMFGSTMMVFCSVTAFGKTMTCQMPVINNQNKPIDNPNAMDVNTAMMRCLAKTIALHGLGIYIYAGEDLPEEEKEAIALANNPEHQRKVAHDAAYEQYKTSVVAIKMGIANNDLSTAKEAWNELDEETKMALWIAPSKGGCFTTQERTVMKSSEWSSTL